MDMIVKSESLFGVAEAIREKVGSSEQFVFPSGFVTAIQGIKGGDLNFEVVGGTTEPENPAENTIWVNTSTKITGWAFAFEKPSSPDEGFVWFRLYNAGQAEFNALTDNAIQVRPESAKQYVYGKWSPVNAKIYQSGWMDIKVERYILSGGSADAGAGACITIGATRYSAGKITTTQNTSTGAYAYFANKIDMTPYNTLRFHATITEIMANLFSVGISETAMANDSFANNKSKLVASATASATGEGWYSVDVSAFDGPYYIAVIAIASSVIDGIVLTSEVYS